MAADASPRRRSRRKVPPHGVADTWRPPAEKMAGLREKFPTVDHEHEIERFLDYHLAKGSLFADWVAAYRTWCRNAIKFGTYPEPRKLDGYSAQMIVFDEIEDFRMTPKREAFLRDNGLL